MRYQYNIVMWYFFLPVLNNFMISFCCVTLDNYIFIDKGYEYKASA